uniref:Protein kinase domain-containing protein n=1 Tax=viral metagenome TaxID=1070528 RepID=A0A6C0CGV3_9ZZZZ
MNLRGGKSISEGFRAKTIDVYDNDNSDSVNLYNMIKNQPSDRILLYGLNKVIKTRGNKDEILKLLENRDDFIAKVFKRGNIILGNSKTNFKSEMKAIKTISGIYKNDLDKYTTFKPIFNYDGIDIYAISYRFNYFILQERCYSTLEKINFTQKEFNKFINEIYESLLILQKNNFIHNDIKADNIIKCNGRYKLIDWDLASNIHNPYMSFAKGSGGNFVFNHPIKFYTYGIPIFLYKVMYAIFINYDKKTYEWLFNLRTFNYIKELSIKSAEYLAYNTDLNKLKNQFDMYSFAILIVFLAEKNNLEFPSDLVNELLAPFHIKL